jgi:ADP-ribose pyrophosphatase
VSEAKPWPELGREHLLDCRIFSVERSTVESPVDGDRYTFFRIVSGDWAQVVPVTADGHLVMVRQYRHGARRVTLEIPGGIVEPDEDPAVAAARECLEETGYRARSLVPMGVLNPNPALFPNRLHTFLAHDVERVAEIQNIATEHTELVLVRREHVAELLMRGEIDHALIAAALWRYLYEAAVPQI